MIETTGLTKSFRVYKKAPGLWGSIKSVFKREYEDKQAVESFSMQAKAGEIIGLLGPNGAGKTTLMKMFTGIIVPSDGEVRVLGESPWERSKHFRKHIALVMGQKSQLWWDIPAMDSFLLLQKYYEVPEEAFRARLATMAKLLQVEDLLTVHVRKLSLGERMKMELMASLIHEPDIIFLDEPTIGLDLVAQENIREFVLSYHLRRKQSNNPCTIVITSHYMADVQALCERLVLLLDGKKAFDGPLQKFEKILGHEKVVTFAFETPQDDCLNCWEGLDAQWSEDRTHVELRVPDDRLREVGKTVLNQCPVVEFNTEKMPIERVLKTLMERPELALDSSHAD